MYFSHKKFAMLSCVPRKSRGKKHPATYLHSLGATPLEIQASGDWQTMVFTGYLHLSLEDRWKSQQLIADAISLTENQLSDLGWFSLPKSELSEADKSGYSEATGIHCLVSGSSSQPQYWPGVFVMYRCSTIIINNFYLQGFHEQLGSPPAN